MKNQENIYICKIKTNLESEYVISLFDLETVYKIKFFCFYAKLQEKRRDNLTCSLPRSDITIYKTFFSSNRQRREFDIENNSNA